MATTRTHRATGDRIKMKKILLIIIMCLSATISFAADGIFPDNLNFALTNAARTEIKIVGADQTGSGFVLKTLAGEDVELYKTATSTEPYTLKDGGSLSIGLARNYSDITLYWAILKTATSDTLEVIIFKQ